MKFLITNMVFSSLMLNSDKKSEKQIFTNQNISHSAIIEHIIHRFGIMQTLIMDQGTSFISNQIHEFVESYKIKLVNTSSNYA